MTSVDTNWKDFNYTSFAKSSSLRAIQHIKTISNEDKEKKYALKYVINELEQMLNGTKRKRKSKRHDIKTQDIIKSIIVSFRSENKSWDEIAQHLNDLEIKPLRKEKWSRQQVTNYNSSQLNK